METENILKLDVTLQKLSAITVALHFWELERVKNQIRDFWKRHYPERKNHNYPESTITRKEWTLHNIRYVENMTDSLDYPAKLLDDIKCYLYVMGGIILDFIQYTSTYGFDLDFGLKICWAPYGRIDEVRMVRECLKGRNENLPLEKRFLYLAGVYTDEDLIRPNMSNIDYGRDGERDIIFRVRYFWNQLPCSEQRIHVVEQAQCCVKLVLDERTKMYTRQRLMELLVIFMTEMSAIQRLQFVTETWDSLFKAFLEAWPYQELCLNILYNIDIECFMAKKLEVLIDYVIDLLNSESVIKYKNKNIYHSILQELLKKTPSESKTKYLKKLLDPNKSLVFDFHRNCDYRTLSIILNDVDAQGIKQKVILGGDYFDQFFKMHVKDRNFDFLDKYLKYVLPNEKERKLFKQKLNWVNEFACEGDFELADQLLNFLFDTETERNQQKKKTLSIEVFKFIKEGNFEKAQQFVEWRYETDEERKKIKNVIYLLEDMEPAVLCTDFTRRGHFNKVDHYLQWRFETEEERRTVKESVLKGIDSVELCNRLVGENEFKTAREYLKWRFQTTEERHDIKRAVLYLQSMNPSEKCHYLIKEKQYCTADEFLIWLCDTEEERRDMKKSEYERETMNPKEFVNILIREKPSLADPYIKWRFESDEERRNFKKVLYKSDECLRNKCYDILFRRNRASFQSLNDECSDMLKFFLELEEAVNEFRKFKLFDKDDFLKKYRSCSSDYCENFLKYCSRSLKDKDIKAALK